MAKAPPKRLSTHRKCAICQSGQICAELEAELAKLNSNLQSKAAKPHLGIENLAAELEEQSKEEWIEYLDAKLRSYALPQIYIDVVIHVCVHNWNFAEIAEELNIVSWHQARTIYNQALELLKERRYK